MDLRAFPQTPAYADALQVRPVNAPQITEILSCYGLILTCRTMVAGLVPGENSCAFGAHYF
jgi:hypothetical protein